MSHLLTRRQMLKLIVAAAATATFSPVLHARAHYPSELLPPGTDYLPGRQVEPWVWMGRPIHTVAFYEEPSASATRLDTRARDQAVELLEEVRAPFSAHNDLWYRTSLGYAHSAWVLPMRIYPPQPFIKDIGEWGFWGEISQVTTGGYTQPSLNARKQYTFYGGCVLWVIDTYEDEAGVGWYKVFDDYPPRQRTNHQWVLAKDVRRVPRQEIAPIRPFVGRKRIEVDLTAQRLTCFEGETPVFTSLIASGTGAHATPTGERSVLLKQGSRHMANTPYEDGPELEDPSDLFDLPGIAWNTFFDLEGRAIHGVYWHNDFGVRRSHGCVNAPNETARFVYRWTHPVGGFEDEFIQSDKRVGTPILFF